MNKPNAAAVSLGSGELPRMPSPTPNIPETGIDYDKLEAHPLANLLPMIEDKAFEDFKADIGKNGMKEKIKLSGILSDSTIGALRIIDGRN
jgi:hypothetical protein